MQVFFLKFRSNKQLIEETIPYLRWSIRFYALLYGAEYSPGAGVAVQCWCVQNKNNHRFLVPVVVFDALVVHSKTNRETLNLVLVCNLLKLS